MSRRHQTWVASFGAAAAVTFAIGGSSEPCLAQATTNTDAAAKDAARVRGGRAKGPSRVGWWNDAVFYQIFVRSFRDSTEGPKANDGIGDLQGLIEKLDYLNDGDPKTTTDLGITGLWLMPICESPSYHGYDVTDYKKIEQDYGTNEDFKQLMAECHKRGIRVIPDLVLNHTSNKHPWFLESRDPRSEKHSWYIWSETNPEWKGPWNQRVWHKSAMTGAGGGTGTEAFYYGLFSPSMPDVNCRSPEASAALLDVVKFWLTDMHVDGYRLDAIRHLIEHEKVQENTRETHEWLREFHTFYKKVNPEAMTIGEVWAPSEQAASYVGDELDMAFEFDLASAMIKSAREGTNEAVSRAQAKVLSLYPPNQYGRFLTNHDQTRVMRMLKNDEGAMRMAATMLLTGPGVPFIYYGEEIGMTGDKPDEYLRTPMQWSGNAGAGFTAAKPWEPANSGTEKRGYESVNVENQMKETRSLLGLYRRLIRIRGEHAALGSGDMIPVESGSKQVYSFLRHAGSSGGGTSEDVLVVINLGNEAVKEFGLSVSRSPLRGAVAAKELLQGADATVPVCDENGGFGGYRPLETLSARTGYVILLGKP